MVILLLILCLFSFTNVYAVNEMYEEFTDVLIETLPDYPSTQYFRNFCSTNNCNFIGNFEEGSSRYGDIVEYYIYFNNVSSMPTPVYDNINNDEYTMKLGFGLAYRIVYNIKFSDFLAFVNNDFSLDSSYDTSIVRLEIYDPFNELDAGYNDFYTDYCNIYFCHYDRMIYYYYGPTSNHFSLSSFFPNGLFFQIPNAKAYPNFSNNVINFYRVFSLRDFDGNLLFNNISNDNYFDPDKPVGPIEENNSWFDEIYNDLLDNYFNNTSISNLIGLPIILVQSLLNSSNNICSSYNLGSLFGTNIVLPCINLEDYLGETLYSTIDILISSILFFNMSKMFVRKFKSILSLEDTSDDVFGGDL